MPAFAYLARVAAKAGCPPMFLEECVQEQELAIWLAPDAPWKTVAHRQAVDFVRQLRHGNQARTKFLSEPTQDIADLNLEAPGDFTKDVDTTVRIDQLLATLPERLEYVIRQHMAGRTFMAIGKDIGVTESRCCQLEKQAIRRIRIAAKKTNGSE
jgi:DNA-directed RNA polymerase sigma subunit (sigma70/sigma32)